MPGDWLPHVKERTHGRNLRHKRLFAQGLNSVSKHFLKSIIDGRFPLGQMGSNGYPNNLSKRDAATELCPQDCWARRLNWPGMTWSWDRIVSGPSWPSTAPAPSPRRTTPGRATATSATSTGVHPATAGTGMVSGMWIEVGYFDFYLNCDSLMNIRIQINLK